MTWPGVFVFDDRRAVDYLASRPDVDATRIGCGGLSGGGLRTVMLTGADELSFFRVVELIELAIGLK